MASSNFWAGYTGGQATAPSAAPATSGGGITGFLKGAVSSIVNPIVNTGKNIVGDFPKAGAQTLSYLTGQTGKVQNSEANLQDLNSSTIHSLAQNMAKATDPTVKARYAAAIKTIGGQNSAENQDNAFVKTAQSQTSPSKIIPEAADAANAAITLGTLGIGSLPANLAEDGVKSALTGTGKKVVSSLIGKASSTPLKTAVTKGAKTAAKYGLAYGALAPVQKGDTNASDIATSSITGGILGGLTGGAFSGGSNILSKVLPKSITSTAANGAKGATKSFTRIAQEANGIKDPLASGSAAAKQYGTNLLGNKLNISAADVDKHDAINTVQALHDNYGLTVDQAAKLHPVVTGGDGTSTESMNNALEGMDKVDFSGFGDEMHKELEDPDFIAGNGLSDDQVKKLGKSIDKYDTTLNPSNSEGLSGDNAADYKINQGSNAKNAMDVAKQLERDGYKNSSNASESKQAIGEMQLKMADNIKRRIYNAPGGDAALQTAKEETANQLDTIAKASGNSKVSKIADNFRNAKTFEEYRNVSAPFVNAKNLSDITEKNNFANKGQGGGAGLWGTLIKVASKAGSPAAAKGMNAIADATSGGGAVVKSPGLLGRIANGASDPSTTLGKVSSEVIGAGQANNVANGSSQQAQATDTSQPIVPSTSFTPSSSSTASTNPFENPQVIQALLLQDIANTGGKNASTILALYNAFKPASTTSTEQTAANAATNAGGAINQIQQDFQAAGGGQGPIAGTLTNLEGDVGLNSNAATYNQTATALAAQVYKALGNTGTISDQDQKLIQSLIPKTTDTATTASQKITQLQTLLQQAQETASGTTAQ